MHGEGKQRTDCSPGPNGEGGGSFLFKPRPGSEKRARRSAFHQPEEKRKNHEAIGLDACEGLCQTGTRHKKNHATLVSAFVRDTFTGRRRGSPGGSGTSGSRGYFHHSNLYTRFKRSVKIGLQRVSPTGVRRL